MSTATEPIDHLPGLRIHLLGGFRVWVGPRLLEESDWKLSAAKNLVKLLALAPGYRLAPEQIIDDLWPEANENAETDELAAAKKMQRFHSTLLQARRALELEHPGGPRGQSLYLSLQRNGLLSLTSPGPLWVDVTAFDAACVEARRAQEIAAYAAALELYGGDLLPEDVYAEWAIGPRSRLKQKYRELLEKLAAVQRARQEMDQAILTLERLVASEPIEESSQRELMRLYALIGKRYQAIQHYQQLQAACEKEGLPLEAETEALYQEIRAGRFPGERQMRSAQVASEIASDSISRLPTNLAQSSQRQQTNLPLRETSFIGRRKEIEEITRGLQRSYLLTLTGAGGSGKSRLAEQVAREVLATYQDGVWLVELVDLSDPQLVPQAVAKVLNIQEDHGKTLGAALVEQLREKDLLLLLDNCEHLLPACAQLVSDLLPHCPHVRILATSRQRLGLGMEETWRVDSLAFPRPDALPPFEHLLDYDAIRLFVERASASKPSFRLTTENANSIVEICHRLDGIPLAIELAAAYVKVAAVEQIAERLTDRLTLLEAKTSGIASRHQTLRATVDWSHALLSPRERMVFRRLAVFRGGWSLEAAEAVCSGEGAEQSVILHVLTELAEKSLLVVEHQKEQARYRFLEVIRQYSEARLEAASESVKSAERHLAWFLVQAERIEPELRSQHQEKWLNWLEQEQDNLRTALRWALEHEATEQGLRLAGALWRFWYGRGHLTEGLGWLERLLSKSQEKGPLVPLARAKALDAAGWLTYLLGNNQQAITWHEAALSLRQASDDKRGMAASCNALGMIAHFQPSESRHEHAFALYSQALALYRELEDRHGIADTLNNLGLLAKDRAQYQQAAALLGEALALFRELLDERRIIGMLINLSDLAYTRGHYAQVPLFAQEALVRARQFKDTPSIASATQNLGQGALYQGAYDHAVAYLQEALALSREQGDRWNTAACLSALGLCLYYRGGDLGQVLTLAQDALALARPLDYHQVVAEALLLLGKISQTQGNPQQALDHYREGLALYQQASDERGMAAALEALAGLAVHQGEPRRALRLFGAAEGLREKIGVALPPCDHPTYALQVAAARAAMDEQTWPGQWAAGRAALLDQMLTEALASEQGVRPLTPREREVAALIARGKKDREIAEALGCELRTVTTHVGRILSKLHMSNRAEIAAWVQTQGHAELTLD